MPVTPSAVPERQVNVQLTVDQSMDYAAEAAIQSGKTPFRTKAELYRASFHQYIQEMEATGWVLDDNFGQLARRLVQEQFERHELLKDGQVGCFSHATGQLIVLYGKLKAREKIAALISSRWEDANKVSDSFWNERLRIVFRENEIIRQTVTTFHKRGVKFPVDLVKYLGL
jgi:hypothetical protein